MIYNNYNIHIQDRRNILMKIIYETLKITTNIYIFYVEYYIS